MESCKIRFCLDKKAEENELVVYSEENLDEEERCIKCNQPDFGSPMIACENCDRYLPLCNISNFFQDN